MGRRPVESSRGPATRGALLLKGELDFERVGKDGEKSDDGGLEEKDAGPGEVWVGKGVKGGGMDKPWGRWRRRGRGGRECRGSGPCPWPERDTEGGWVVVEKGVREEDPLFPRGDEELDEDVSALVRRLYDPEGGGGERGRRWDSKVDHRLARRNGYRHDVGPVGLRVTPAERDFGKPGRGEGKGDAGGGCEGGRGLGGWGRGEGSREWVDEGGLDSLCSHRSTTSAHPAQLLRGELPKAAAKFDGLGTSCISGVGVGVCGCVDVWMCVWGGV